MQLTKKQTNKKKTTNTTQVREALTRRYLSDPSAVSARTCGDSTHFSVSDVRPVATATFAKPSGPQHAASKQNERSEHASALGVAVLPNKRNVCASSSDPHVE